MRKLYLFILFACLSVPLAAQIQIGNATVPVMGSPGRLSPEDLAAFRKTTTLFTLRAEDYRTKRDAFAAAIAKAWTITPFRIITPDSVKEYINDSLCSFATYEIYNLNTGVNLIDAFSLPQFSYDIWMPQFTTGHICNGKTILGRITLAPTRTTVLQWPGKNKAYDFMYEKAAYNNWQPGFVMNYLRVMNDCLLQGRRRGMFDAVKNNEGLHALQNETLYVPVSAIAGGDSLQLSAVYPYRAQYITDEELNSRIIAGTETIYYLVFLLCDKEKYVNVFTSDGRELYTIHRSLRYLLDAKDFKKISEAIEK